MGRPAAYQIEVHEYLDEHWSDWFDGDHGCAQGRRSGDEYHHVDQDSG
jgi:hypothetical protein